MAESSAERDHEVFSGHESFVCRYGWIPKLYEAVVHNPDLFADDDESIVTLGIGKNMVRSIRFWGQSFGLTNTVAGRSVKPTSFATHLLHERKGLDPYLEDLSSLWRLHWVLTARAGLAAWAVALLEFHDNEISKDNLVELVRRRALAARGAVTSGTVAQHVDIFLKTYDAGRSSGLAVAEDGLGCPLQELGLLETDESAGTSVVRLRRGPKADLDVHVLAFAIADFWRTSADGSKTVSMRSLMLDRRSPGVIFRLDEASMHLQLESLCKEVRGFSLREDGVGGIDLVASSRQPIEALEEFSWRH